MTTKDVPRPSGPIRRPAEEIPTPDPVSLEIVRAIRESGLSKTEVAHRLGVRLPTLSEMTGPTYHSHSVPSLRRLAAALGLRLEVRLVAPDEAAKERLQSEPTS